MNKVVTKVVNFFWELDSNQFKKLLLGSVLTIIALFSLMLYVQFKGIRKLKREMININDNRMRIKEILEKNEVLKKHRAHVEEIIAQDKKFKLGEYIEQTVKQLDLVKNLKAYPLSINDLEHLRSKGYEQVRMEADFVNLNMKQLVDLLQELEQNNRIDIKNLDITKSKKQATIDVQIIITTLQQKIETSEEME